MDYAATEIEKGIELQSRVVVEFKGIEAIKTKLTSSDLKLDSVNGLIWYPINDRWYFKIVTSWTDSNQLYLSFYPTATHHEYYILGNMSRRYAKVSAQLRRKVVIAGRKDDCLSQIEFNLDVQLNRAGWMQMPLLKNKLTLLYDEGVKRDDCFVVEITMKENNVVLDNLAPLPSLSFDLASKLLDPNEGDVVIVVPDPSTGQDRKVFAHKHILASNSEYFACRLKPEWTSRPGKVDDTSSTRPSSSPQPNVTNPECIPPTPETRLTLYFNDPEDDIDFVTLHNIIYYIYTKSVNLRIDGIRAYPANDTELIAGHPPSPDPFDLYRNAKKFLLDPLAEYCFEYLRMSTMDFNILARLFRLDTQLEHHDTLRNMYLGQLVARYDWIKSRQGWREIVCNELDISAETRQHHEQLLFQISQRVTSDSNPLKVFNGFTGRTANFTLS